MAGYCQSRRFSGVLTVEGPDPLFAASTLFRRTNEIAQHSGHSLMVASCDLKNTARTCRATTH